MTDFKIPTPEEMKELEANFLAEAKEVAALLAEVGLKAASDWAVFAQAVAVLNSINEQRAEEMMEQIPEEAVEAMKKAHKEAHKPKPTLTLVH